MISINICSSDHILATAAGNGAVVIWNLNKITKQKQGLCCIVSNSLKNTQHLYSMKNRYTVKLFLKKISLFPCIERVLRYHCQWPWISARNLMEKFYDLSRRHSSLTSTNHLCLPSPKTYACYMRGVTPYQ